jgi:hypothetical protein
MIENNEEGDDITVTMKTTATFASSPGMTR